MALTPNQRIAKLREKNIRQVDIAKILDFKWISLVNNVLHNRTFSGAKTERIKILVTKILDLPHEEIWGSESTQ